MEMSNEFILMLLPFIPEVFDNDDDDNNSGGDDSDDD
jgi:hypothetical protein